MNLEPQRYTPIACGTYDLFEIAIMQQKEVELVYKIETGETQVLRTTLVNTLTQSKEEFVVLPDGQTIRMDHIVSLDGQTLAGHC